MQNAFRSLILATSLVFAGTAPASAQTTSPYFDFDLGGWVDEDAGLVWGYAWEAFSPILNYDGQSAEWGAEDYADPGRNLDVAGLEWEEEAIVAMFWQSEGFHWRLPTKEEADDATQKGFFANPDFRDSLGFSRTSARWTLSRRGQKRYWFDGFGNSGWVNNGSCCRLPIVVRPLTLPPPDDDGPGNGNGKNK